MQLKNILILNYISKIFIEEFSLKIILITKKKEVQIHFSNIFGHVSNCFSDI